MIVNQQSMNITKKLLLDLIEGPTILIGLYYIVIKVSVTGVAGWQHATYG
jgi:hypothetical protein